MDLNCGCSVPKVLKADCGALLLRNPALIGSIVAAMKAETDVARFGEAPPGLGRVQLTYLACAEAAVKAGASLVTLHPRTRAQGFSGTSQWAHIRALKEACPVPVIGSGDLFTARDCLRMITTTGCDGVMIARGCLGNPFIFAQAEALLQGRTIEDARRTGGAAFHRDPAPADAGRERRGSKGVPRHAQAFRRVHQRDRGGLHRPPERGLTRSASTNTRRSWRATSRE